MPSRRNSSFSEHDLQQKRNYSYVSAIAVATIQILLSQLLLCYGVFLMRFVLDESFYSLADGLWTVVSYTASKKFTQPWVRSYCKYARLLRKQIDKRNIIVCAFMLSICLFIVCLTNTRQTQIFLYGTACGFFSSIIQTHLSSYTYEEYDTYQLIAQPVGLCFAPHLILFLTGIYDVLQTHFLISALVLNIVPACMAVRNRHHARKASKNRILYKLPTFSKLSMVLSSNNSHKENSDSSDEDDEEELEESGFRNEAVGTENEIVYYQNANIFKILPDIPEENEPEDDDADDINEMTLQKMSRINELFHGLNSHRKDNSSVNNYYDESIETSSLASEIQELPQVRSKLSRCFSISSDTVFNLKARKKRLKHFYMEHFVRSIPRTLCSLYFYPILICSSVLSFLSPIFLATAPIIALEKSTSGMQNEWTIADSTFLLSIVGFAWTFFLIAYPILKRFSPFKKRLAFIAGFLLTGSSFFVAQRFTNHHLTGSCLIFGFGYGIVSFTESFAYKEFCGEKQFKKLQGPVEICGACLVILVYTLIYFLWDVRILLEYAHWPYVFCAGLWTISHIFKCVVIRFRSMKRSRKERFPQI